MQNIAAVLEGRTCEVGPPLTSPPALRGVLTRLRLDAIDTKGAALIKLASGGILRGTGKEIRYTAHVRIAKTAALLFAQAKWGKGISLEGNQIQRKVCEQKL